MQFEYQSKTFNIEGVSKNDHIYKSIAQSGNFYEIDLLNYIYHIKPFIYSKKHKNIILDVGANIGNHSIFFSSFISDHLIAIEPNSAVLPQLRLNLSKNIDNYTLYECGVGEKEGRGKMVVPENIDNNIGAARIDLQSNDSDIEISTLDSVFAAWRKEESTPICVSVIKIDVEGMEPQVLKGAENMIIEYKPHIFTEAATKKELKKIYNFLRPLNYRKLPGHWAATPVYHFAHNPPLSLVMIAYYMQVKRVIGKIKSRLTNKDMSRG